LGNRIIGRGFFEQTLFLDIVLDLLAELGVEGDDGLALPAGGFVEDVAGGEGRTVEVEGHGGVAVGGVGHPVHPQFITHVANRVIFKFVGGNDLHRVVFEVLVLFVFLVFRPGVSYFFESSV